MILTPATTFWIPALNICPNWSYSVCSYCLGHMTIFARGKSLARGGWVTGETRESNARVINERLSSANDSARSLGLRSGNRVGGTERELEERRRIHRGELGRSRPTKAGDCSWIGSGTGSWRAFLEFCLRRFVYGLPRTPIFEWYAFYWRDEFESFMFIARRDISFFSELLLFRNLWLALKCRILEYSFSKRMFQYRTFRTGLLFLERICGIRFWEWSKNYTYEKSVISTHYLYRKNWN